MCTVCKSVTARTTEPNLYSNDNSCLYTPNTKFNRNVFDRCEERTYEQADGHLLLSVLHSVMDSVKTTSKKKKRRIHLPFEG